TIRADIAFLPRPFAPSIDVLEHVLDEREMSPRALERYADEADGCLSSRYHILFRAGGCCSHDLVAGDADLGRFLEGRRGHDAYAAQDDPVGLGNLDPQPRRLLVKPRQLYGQVLHGKTVPGSLLVEDGNGFPAIVVIPVDMSDFPALELCHAANPLTDEADLGRVLTQVVARWVEDVGKHPPIRSVRAPIAYCEQGDLVVRGPLRQGIGHWRAA